MPSPHNKNPWCNSNTRALLCSAIALSTISACTTPPALQLPDSPSQPWEADAKVWSLSSEAKPPAPPALAPYPVFTVPPIPQLPALGASATYASGSSLHLPQLIDIAQRENPSTKQAWNRAREAALSAGLTDALFLPSITASVIAGEQRLRIPIDLPLNLGSTHIDNKVRGTTPFLTLTWLLFDFGERNALREGAQYASLAANVLFNATHQKLIRDVTDAFYRYSAARTSLELARQSLTKHEHVLQAVDARWKAGLATRIDIALAKQALAQGRLNTVTHAGIERNSYLTLMAAMGLPPDTQLDIAVPVIDALPSSVEQLSQQRIETVIAQRADIAAAYAAVKIADAGQRAAKAAFMPKVYMGAGLAKNHSNFQAGNLPGIGTQNAASNVFIGVSVPLYDGGLRSRQLSKTEVIQEQAQLELDRLHMTAVREIVAAEQVLQTALESHEAAQELVQMADVVHSAALESYRVGRASTILLTESAIQLNKAQQALAETQYAAIAAAANLAFVMGTMVSPAPDWWPPSNPG